MTVVDYSIIVILVISMIFGIMRGFFKEVISLGSWILGIWAAFTFSTELAPKLIPNLPFVKDMEFFADSLLRQSALCGLIIFTAFALVGGIINFIVNKISEKTGLGGMNRFLGMLFGAARGVLIVSIATLFITNSPLFSQEPVWADSMLRPHAERVASMVEEIVPEPLLAYLPGRDESYGMLSGLQVQALTAVLKDQGVDLGSVDLSQIDVDSIDLSKLDTEVIDPEKAKEYLQQLKRHQK